MISDSIKVKPKAKVTYKHITITEQDLDISERKPFYLVENNSSGDGLGTIEWYAHWRQYVISPFIHAVFSHDCLTDIANFMTGISTKRKSAPK